MKISPNNFKEELQNKLIELHWKQWTALGLSSNVKEQSRWFIDLESLILSTLFIGRFDKRLLGESLGWILKNRRYINLSRLKNLSKHFLEKIKYPNGPLIIEGLIDLIEEIQRTADSKIGGIDIDSVSQSFPEEYSQTIRNMVLKNSVVEPQVKKNASMQLHLRCIFGVNARVEILLYLMTIKEGNSNRIAKEIFYNQKIVYRILESWSGAGFLARQRKKRETLYLLQDGSMFVKSISDVEKFHYINWGEFFTFFDNLLLVLDAEPWSSDAYLVSSSFRNVIEEAIITGRYFDITYPDIKLYQGDSFFHPFASKTLDILTKTLK
ncbi:MAG: hypothetical protein P9M13_02740 [Candidatus Ancaeobacter aquaticus]|nr:hypothetical protein [Candidatus Ancaeobacter aquaticus]